MCLAFLIILALWYTKTRCNLCIQIPPELEQKCVQIKQGLINCRQTNPAMFCAISSGCLGALAIIGHLVSGSMVVVTGLIVAAIISTKYNFKVMKIEPKGSLLFLFSLIFYSFCVFFFFLDFAWSEKIQQDATDIDDEFLPEVNDTNMFLLERASDLASLTLPTEDPDNDEEKSDEVPSELLLPDQIPEIDENSTDDEEHDDLLPLVKGSKSKSQLNQSANNLELVKYSQTDDSIEFKKGHFKKDSSLSTTSSSSEESLSKGLQFPDHTEVDNSRIRQKQIMPAESHLQDDLVEMAVKSQTQALLANSSSLIPSLVSGLMQGLVNAGRSQASTNTATANRRMVTALDSSDESDFEILEKEDFK